MNTTLVTITLSISLQFVSFVCAQEKSNPPSRSAESTPSGTGQTSSTAADPEAKFKALLTDAFLAGRWAPLKDGQLGEEKSGDKYNIVSATKTTGDNWIISAKLKYHDQEFVLPIPVQVKFAGDAAIMVVDKLAIPNGGTYSARLMFYERTYSGTWSGARGGGMLYGVITNGANKEEKSASSPPQEKQ